MVSLTPSLLLLGALFSLAVAQKTKNCPINSVCFAIDHSGSISSTEYDEEIKFVKSIANEIGSRTKDVLYSAYGFSSSSFLMQGGTKDLKGKFNPTIMNFPKSSGGTNMRAGLQSCFDEVKGNKGNRLVVLVTDGADGSIPNALDLAPTVKKAGVSIVTVGVGNGIQEDYLKDLATSPKFFVKSDDFSVLLDKVIDVVEDSCTVVTSPTTPPPTPKPVKTAKPTKKPVKTKKPKKKPAAGNACQKAFRACDFTFKGKGRKVPTFSTTGKPDVPFTTLIVSRSKKEKLGILNTNGIVPEFILHDGKSKPITQFGNPRFTPTHFKPFSIKGTQGSGIGHQTYHGNQEVLSRKKCIRVWFTHYQRFVGKTVENINVKKGDKRKCVVFRSA